MGKKKERGPQHTPGPWHIESMIGDRVATIATDKANEHGDGPADYVLLLPSGPRMADGRLMAAAPELLEALEALLSEVDGAASNANTQAAKAAIAKARG